MGMAVQKAVSETDEAGAKRRMQASYSQRNLMQMLWAILAIVLHASSLPQDPAAFNSGNGHQAEGHKKQHKALNLIFGESRKDGTAFLNRNCEAAIRL